MGRIKKTTVNHFLNTRLKPKKVENELGEFEDRYPIYVKIRSHYKQTQIKSIFWLFQFDHLNQMPQLKKLTESDLDDSNLYLTVEKFDEHLENKTAIYQLLQRESEFITSVAESVTSIVNENFDIKLITNNLFDLMIPVQQLVYDTYSNDLRNILNENRYNDLVEIVDWELPFWKLFLGLYSSQRGGDQNNPLKLILDKNVAYHNLVMSLKHASNDKIIWTFEWGSHLANPRFLDTLKKGIERGDFTANEYKKFIMMISEQIGRKLHNAIYKDLEL